MANGHIMEPGIPLQHDQDKVGKFERKQYVINFLATVVEELQCRSRHL
jgi:hypothetical protein